MSSNLIQCKDCGNQVSRKAKSCPKCGAPAPKGIGCLSMLVLFVGGMLVIGLIIESINPTPPTPEKIRNPIEEQFSAWDGSHFFLVELTKKGMNDANSFEHVKTTYSAAGEKVTVYMQFRGKNVFGGMVLDDVAAEFTKDGEFIQFLKTE